MDALFWSCVLVAVWLWLAWLAWLGVTAVGRAVWQGRIAASQWIGRLLP